MFKKKLNHKGLSTVVASIIMIGLVMAAGIIVWTIINETVQEGLSEASSCANVFEKVIINNQYTCYNSTSKEIKFLIEVKDIELDSLLISIGSETTKQSFEITNTEAQYEYLRKFSGSYNAPIKVPNKNSGITFVANLDSLGIVLPSLIEVAPNINGNQCQVSDSLTDIPDCRLLA